jgi:GTP-binding protein HflX
MCVCPGRRPKTTREERPARAHNTIANLFVEREAGGERALLVSVALEGEADPEPEEFLELARAAGAEVLALETAKRRQPDRRTYLGSGRAEALRDQVQALEAELVIFDQDLSPAQERNLEALVQARVLSRTGLILDIFAQRARTHEGKLQVELAQLEHLSTRLVRGWTHLDRQKGGIGMRGAGETQLELDQRMVRTRIGQVKRRLADVRAQRAQSRRARQRRRIPSVALVGYTNSGKSTLFNALADASVLAADQLFATLDPTLRRLAIAGLGPAVLADTVGFVRRLPHRLVEAFKATLEEVSEADVLLLVIDIADPAWEDKRAEVLAVLEELGASAVPRIEVHNKIDLTEDSQPRCQPRPGFYPALRVSAAAGLGFDLIHEALATELGRALGGAVRGQGALAPEAGRLRAELHQQGWVEAEVMGEDGEITLSLRLPRDVLPRLEAEGLRFIPA